eukprot:g1503.t1
MRGLGYQIVTVPTEHYNEDALHRSIGALCDVTRYSMPQLRVGTLNVLISLSDELAKLNAACAMLVSQIEKLGREIHAQRFERSTAHWSDVEGKDKFQYAKTFQWKEMKYPTSRSLADLTKLLQMSVSKMEEELRQFQVAYAEKKQLRQKAERSRRGNLLNANLHGVLAVENLVTFDGTRIPPCIVEQTGVALKRTDFVNSQFLRTVLIGVPNSLVEQFQNTHESLGGGEDGVGSVVPLVVPGSLCRILSDKDCVLFSLIVLKSQRADDGWGIADTFYNECRAKRYVVRPDFTVDPEKTLQAFTEAAKLDSDFNLYEGKTLEWAKVHFGESVIGLLHIKSVQVFIESVLRYGLPPEFTSLLLDVNDGKMMEVRKQLGKLYGHLAEEEYGTEENDGAGAEFFPYVSVEL